MTDEEQRDIQMIKRPDEWPQWPFLPIKKYADGGGWPKMAIIQASDPCTIIEANLFNLPKAEGDFKALPRKTYQSVEDVVTDGWVVD